MHAVCGVYTVCIRYPAFLYFSAVVCYYFFVQEILTNHRVLGIDISQPDLDLEARQEKEEEERKAQAQRTDYPVSAKRIIFPKNGIDFNIL